jgi:hypothetical protein
VFVRVGQDGDGAGVTYFIDLGDSSGRAVAICDREWSVIDRPGVHFRRPAGLLRLPMPARDGSIDLLRTYVNLTEPDFRLMIAWLTAALRPVGPYPVLVLNGEQSSGKSTLARILRLLKKTSNRENVLAGVSRRLSADLGRRARRDRRRPARAAVG